MRYDPPFESGKYVAVGQKPYECKVCGCDIPVGAESYTCQKLRSTFRWVFAEGQPWRECTVCYEGRKEEERIALRILRDEERAYMAAIEAKNRAQLIAKRQMKEITE